MTGDQTNSEELPSKVGPRQPIACWQIDSAGRLHPQNTLAEAASPYLDAESIRAIVSGRKLPLAARRLGLRWHRLRASDVVLVVADLEPTARDIALARAQQQWKLSDRELEVLDLLADGDKPVEMARKLGIAAYTAQKHVSHLLFKAGCRSSVEMVGKLPRML